MHHTFINLIQSTLDLRNSIFPFLNRELFDLRKIYVLILKTGHPKKMSYVGVEIFLKSRIRCNVNLTWKHHN